MDPERYEPRINRAIALLERELADDVSLDRLADEACLSRFHFHRIFTALSGESVHAMVTRMRIERALAMTQRGRRPQWKQVAAQVGYNSPDVFARAFKRQLGCAPSQFDLEAWWHERPDRDEALGVSRYFLRPAPPLPADFAVTVIDRPAARLVVSRAVGGYLDPARMMRAYQRIEAAGRVLGIDLPGHLSGASRDDPELVPLSRCRYDFCLEVAATTPAPLRLLTTVRPAGRWAVTRVVGNMAAVDRSWNLLFKSWLPAAGLDLRPAPAEEIYHRSPDDIGWDRFDLTLAIPVEA